MHIFDKNFFLIHTFPFHGSTQIFIEIFRHSGKDITFWLHANFSSLGQREKNTEKTSTYRLDRCVLVVAKHRMRSMGDELVVQALAAINVANGATAADDETSVVLGIQRPVARVDTSVDSGMEIRIRVAIA